MVALLLLATLAGVSAQESCNSIRISGAPSFGGHDDLEYPVSGDYFNGVYSIRSPINIRSHWMAINIGNHTRYFNFFTKNLTDLKPPELSTIPGTVRRFNDRSVYWREGTMLYYCREAGEATPSWCIAPTWSPISGCNCYVWTTGGSALTTRSMWIIWDPIHHTHTGIRMIATCIGPTASPTQSPTNTPTTVGYSTTLPSRMPTRPTARPTRFPSNTHRITLIRAQHYCASATHIHWERNVVICSNSVRNDSRCSPIFVYGPDFCVCVPLGRRCEFLQSHADNSVYRIDGSRECRVSQGTPRLDQAKWIVPGCMVAGTTTRYSLTGFGAEFQCHLGRVLPTGHSTCNHGFSCEEGRPNGARWILRNCGSPSILYEGYTTHFCNNGTDQSIYSTCKGRFPPLAINLAIALIGVLATLLSYLITKKPGARHIAIFQSFVAICDAYTDTVLAFQLAYVTSIAITYFWVWVSLLAVSVAFNIFAIYYALHGEGSQHSAFSQWRQRNRGAFNWVSALSAIDMQMMLIINSRVYDLDATSVDLPYNVQRRLNIMSYVAMLVENIPQVGFQLFLLAINVSSDMDFKVNVIVATVLSALDILSSIVGMIFTAMTPETAPSELQMHLLTLEVPDVELLETHVQKVSQENKRLRCENQGLHGENQRLRQILKAHEISHSEVQPPKVSLGEIQYRRRSESVSEADL